MLQYLLKAWISYKKISQLSSGFANFLKFYNFSFIIPFVCTIGNDKSQFYAKQRAGLKPAPTVIYFFMEALTMASTSSGVSMGDAISFLGHTAAHKPQEVQRL